MTDLEIIERYYTGKLSLEELNSFNRRKTEDPVFRRLTNDYRMTLDALRRTWVADTIRGIKYSEWIRKAVYGLLIAAAALCAWFWVLSKKNASANVQKEIPASVVQSDTGAPHGYALASDTILSNVLPIQRLYQDHRDKSIGSSGLSASLPFDSSTTFASKPPDGPVLSEEVHWQEFRIDNTVKDSIELESGTCLSFEPYTLQTVSGQQKLNDVKIRVKEFVNYYDLFRENIHTTSDGQLLKTGGSCLIEAISDSQEVQVIPGKSFTLRFRGVNDPNMRTFYGSKTDSGRFNWVPDSVRTGLQKKTIYRDKGFYTTRRVHWYDAILKLFRIPNRRNTIRDMEDDTIYSDFRGNKSDLVRLYPSDSSLNQMTNVDQSQAMYNQIVSSQFGYINCDAFYRDRNKITMLVKADSELKEVRVFYKELSAVMNQKAIGKQSMFVLIPRDLEVLIIATTKSGNEMFIQEALTSREVQLVNPEPFNLLKIKEKLEGYRQAL